MLSRGWIYAAVAGLAWAAHLQRRRWLDALDRRFFRERYDAQRLMLKVVEEVRHAPGLQSVAPQVVAQIEAALHPEYVALLVREAGDPLYRTLASVPAGGIPLSLSGASKVAALVRLLGKPLDVGSGQSGWIRQQLPADEAELVRNARAGLLVPVATAPAGPEVLLALGEKRSEEPYSSEDQEFLAAVAASLGLLVDRPAPGAAADSFAECPQLRGLRRHGGRRARATAPRWPASNCLACWRSAIAWTGASAAAAWARCTRRSTPRSTGASRSRSSARTWSGARRPPTGSASRRARPRASRIPTSSRSTTSASRGRRAPSW